MTIDEVRPKVLVIDDDPLLAVGIRRGLQEDNEVEVQHDPMVALARIRGGTPLDVILCDVMMPILSGIDLYEALAQTHPELTSRVVFLSGGACTDRVARFLSETPNRWLGKPYRLHHLREVVRDVAQITRGARPPMSTRTG